MKADSRTIRREARGVIKTALASYSGLDEHVAIYILDRCEHRNDVQAALARTDDLTSEPTRIGRIIDAVREHLIDRLQQYFNQ